MWFSSLFNCSFRLPLLHCLTSNSCSIPKLTELLLAESGPILTPSLYLGSSLYNLHSFPLCLIMVHHEKILHLLIFLNYPLFLPSLSAIYLCSPLGRKKHLLPSLLHFYYNASPYFYNIFRKHAVNPWISCLL